VLSPVYSERTELNLTGSYAARVAQHELAVPFRSVPLYTPIVHFTT